MADNNEELEGATADRPSRALSYPLKSISRAIYLLEVIVTLIAGAALIVSMLAIVLDAGGRYFFSSPLVGTREVVSGILMVAVVWLSFSRTQRLEGHVRMDLFLQKAPAKAQRITRMIGYIVGIGVALVFAITTFGNFMDGLGTRIIGAITLPVWPAWAIACVGSLVFLARLIVMLLQTMVEMSHPSKGVSGITRGPLEGGDQL